MGGVIILALPLSTGEKKLLFSWKVTLGDTKNFLDPG